MVLKTAALALGQLANPSQEEMNAYVKISSHEELGGFAVEMVDGSTHNKIENATGINFSEAEAKYLEENPAKLTETGAESTDEDNSLEQYNSKEDLLKSEFWSTNKNKIKELEKNVSSSNNKEEFEKNLAEYISAWEKINPTVKQYVQILKSRETEYDNLAQEYKQKHGNNSYSGQERSMAFSSYQIYNSKAQDISFQIDHLITFFGTNKKDELTANFAEKMSINESQTNGCTIENKSADVLEWEKKNQMEVITKDGRFLVSHNGEIVSTITYISKTKSHTLSISENSLLFSSTNNEGVSDIVEYYNENGNIIEKTENSGTSKLFTVVLDNSLVNR